MTSTWTEAPNIYPRHPNPSEVSKTPLNRSSWRGGEGTPKDETQQLVNHMIQMKTSKVEVDKSSIWYNNFWKELWTLRCGRVHVVFSGEGFFQSFRGTYQIEGIFDTPLHIHYTHIPHTCSGKKWKTRDGWFEKKRDGWFERKEAEEKSRYILM